MLYQSSFLERIIKSKKVVLEKKISQDPYLNNIKDKAGNAPIPYNFYDALNRFPNLAIIAEIKRASPSCGMMRADLDSAILSKTYQSLGASALSVITEETFFHGSLIDLKNARDSCSLSLLRKDFIIHPYQIFEARAYGADAILLIASVLTEDELLELINLAHKLGMYALVEIHRAEEIPAVIKSGARIIGINNRDLATFQVNIKTTELLAPLIPKDRFLISESGIKGPEEAKKVASWGAKGILVGEALITSPDLDKLLKTLTRIKCVQE